MLAASGPAGGDRKYLWSEVPFECRKWVWSTGVIFHGGIGTVDIRTVNCRTRQARSPRLVLLALKTRQRAASRPGSP
jgi:hypothetical protein